MSRPFRKAGGLAVTVLLLAGTAGGPWAAGEDEGQAIARAVEAIRGQDLTKLSGDEKDEFGERLDAAWEFLIEHRKKALPAVEAALTREQEDSFRIIDLAHLLVVLDTDRAEQSAGFLLKVDPNSYPAGYFDSASAMAALRCKACLPAVLRMLELEHLDTAIPEHALPIGIDLGITFTIAPYGDAALAGVREALTSEQCAERANAALAIALLLPSDEPPVLGKMALEDSCEAARRGAWGALGALDSPVLARLATERLEAAETPSIEEREAIAGGLSAAFSRTVLAPLERLASDPDPGVAKRAREGRDGITRHAPTIADLKARAGSGSPALRSKVQRLLKGARDRGHFEFEGKRLELLPALTAADLPLLNEARASVLRRISDECLDEYYDLRYIARALRLTAAAPEPP